MQRCARDVALLSLNELSTHASDYGADEQPIFHTVKLMRFLTLHRLCLAIVDLTDAKH